MVGIILHMNLHKCFQFSVNKQINDKERVAAALENPSLMQVVEKCLEEKDY